jgi:DNA repair protein RadC
MKMNYTDLVECRILVKHQILQDKALLDTPDAAYETLINQCSKSPCFHPDKENFIALFLDTRRCIEGFEIVSQGSLNSCLIHPRELFRPAIVRNTDSIILAHNHPSGDVTPSDADIMVTRNMIRAGQLLHISVMDHIIFTNNPIKDARPFASLRELGYFYS